MSVREELRAELLRRREIDQEVRKADSPEPGRMHEVDADNTAWIREVIETNGWPGISLAGKDGANAAWLLVQHAPLDLQEECLPLLEQAVERGEARKVDWAYLLDRVLMRRGEPQLFGTQFVSQGEQPAAHPIKDPETVDERRAELGLEPMADYAKRFQTK